MPKNHSCGSVETWPKISFTCRTSLVMAWLLGFMTTSTFVPEDDVPVAPLAPAVTDSAAAARMAAATSNAALTGSTLRVSRGSVDGRVAPRNLSIRDA